MRIIKLCILFLCCLPNIFINAQTISKKLQTAFQKFEADAQLKNAISSLYVIDAKTGKVVFDKNSKIGLAPASTQKIITAATAYELLGRSFRYETKLAYSKAATSNLMIIPSGDPTFGSWRWKETGVDHIFAKMVAAVKTLPVHRFDSILFDNSGWNSERIPDGWIWQDIGAYYGAGAGKMNLRENQFDLLLKSGSQIGDSVVVVGIEPTAYEYHGATIRSDAKAAAKGTGDNAYLYYSQAGTGHIWLRGTIPQGENRFRISVSDPHPELQFMGMLVDTLITISKLTSASYGSFNDSPKDLASKYSVFYTHFSPTLDSMIYWFLKRSINLYGEGFIKTFAFKKSINASTQNGIEQLKDFWKDKGIGVTAINLFDGSGLSPLNRVTTQAQATVLQYAKKQPWFNGFYESFPEFNGMKMKSGTISGVKAFCGYHRSKTGQEYIFSFLVNNYNGSSSSVVQKMYKVLDELK